jgi:hypothetical protein
LHHRLKELCTTGNFDDVNYGAAKPFERLSTEEDMNIVRASLETEKQYLHVGLSFLVEVA